MNKVYVVAHADYDEWNIKRIFDSREKAESYRNGVLNSVRLETYPYGGQNFVIGEFEYVEEIETGEALQDARERLQRRAAECLIIEEHTVH